MKLKQFIFVTGITLTMLAITNSRSQAAVLQNAQLATRPYGTSVPGECSTFGLCNPGNASNLTYDPGSSSTYAINDSTFDFTSFTYTILPSQSAVWDPASTFTFFRTKNISSDGKVLTFSNGVFPSGAAALFSAVSTESSPVSATVTFGGTPANSVPEPTNILGVLVGGTLCLAAKKKLG